MSPGCAVASLLALVLLWRAFRTDLKWRLAKQRRDRRARRRGGWF